MVARAPATIHRMEPIVDTMCSADLQIGVDRVEEHPDADLVASATARASTTVAGDAAAGAR